MPQAECVNCLMNSSIDPHIRFNEKGYCNYCTDYQKKHQHFEQLIQEQYYQKQIDLIKRSKRKQQRYDCVLGVSGGTDSSYVTYLLYKAGLNALLVHCDNGWDTEVAVANLEKITRKTSFDLHIRKINCEAFYAVQKSLLKARVVDIELLSDHVNIASIYEVAYRERIPWLITGENINTECFMPAHWVHNKNDFLQLSSINEAFENVDLSDFPKLGPYRKFFIDKMLHTRYFKPLNFIDYDKYEAAKIIAQEFGWEDHGGKHFESYFTIFYQCYLLPKYFHIDKRVVHLSNLICSGAISREDGKTELGKPIIDEPRLAFIKEMVLDKLKITATELDKMMKEPMVPHSQYKSYLIYRKPIQALLRRFR